MAELTPAELEGRVQGHRDPARLVSPVFEDGRAGPEQLLAHARVETLEARKENDGVAPRAGDGHGIELQIAEAADDGEGGGKGGRAAAAGMPRQARRLGKEQAGAGKGQPP